MISIDFQQFLQHQEMAAPGPIEVLLHCLPNQQRRWRLVRSQWPDAPDSDVHCHPEVDVAETQALGDCARPAAAAADQSHWSHFVAPAVATQRSPVQWLGSAVVVSVAPVAKSVQSVRCAPDSSDSLVGMPVELVEQLLGQLALSLAESLELPAQMLQRQLPVD